MNLSFPQVVTILQLLIAAAVALMLLYELASGRTAIKPTVGRNSEPSRYWLVVGLHALIAAAIVYMALN